MKIYALFDPKGKMVDVFNEDWLAWVRALNEEDDLFKAEYYAGVPKEVQKHLIARGWTMKKGEFVADGTDPRPSC